MASIHDNTPPEIIAAKARLIMELRALGIRDTETLVAIETIPRERFLPPVLAKHAYDNVSLPLSHGQTISQPFVVARMTEALELTPRHVVLEIGTGSGYQAAVLSRLVRRVYTMERLRPLLVEAERRLAGLRIANCTARLGDGAAGWPEAAPFDRIIITCAAPARPGILLRQLKPGGILIAPVDSETGMPGAGQTLRLYRKSMAEAGAGEGDDGGGGESTITEEALLPVHFVPLVTDIEMDAE